jgi:3-deoxy-D-manno-octulosonic-acid transferase
VGLFVDSDIWPNLVLNAKTRGVKLALINARMSERSFAGWRWAPKTAAVLLSAFDSCLAQDEEIASRFRQLGARNVRAVGSLKADAPPLAADMHHLAMMCGAISGRPVLLAAQTHPGEDETILPVHDALRRTIPDLLTIIVPRHVERGPETRCSAAHADAATRWARCLRRCSSLCCRHDGELGLFYRLAPFAFVGEVWCVTADKSLEPARRPAFWRVATCFTSICGDSPRGLGIVRSVEDRGSCAPAVDVRPRRNR